MKHVLRFLLLFLTVSISLCGQVSPHLVLYFDINKTLIASDKAGNKSVEDVLNELLAEKYMACWDESLQEAITFDVYVHEILVPGSWDNRELRNQRRFYLQHFIDYLREQNHPLYHPVLEEYETALMALNTSESVIFRSFFSLLEHLDRKGISYSIILRSFGEEIFDVKNEINAVHKMIFKRTGKFREGRLFLEEEEGSLEDSYAIYNHFRRIEHSAIHDDWKYWNAHSMSAKQGKPFYVDREDNETLSIFFDDNIREEDSNNNIIAPLDAATGEIIPIQELLESGQAVRVETLNAILNTDYYIKLVDEALYKKSIKDDLEWRMGGKIHFEEESGPDYIGIKEINEIVKNVLKNLININTDFCSPNAKIMLKRKNDEIKMTHYEEKSRPGIGEEMHATLLYTRPRGFCSSETLNQICENLFEKCDFPPSIESVAKAYSSIIKPEWKFKISEVILTKSATGASFIIAKLLSDGCENIYKSNKPISAGLHMTLVNSDDSILAANEISDLLIKEINTAIKDKMVKIATKNGVADLEFGISGLAWRIRAEERME